MEICVSGCDVGRGKISRTLTEMLPSPQQDFTAPRSQNHCPADSHVRLIVKILQHFLPSFPLSSHRTTRDQDINRMATLPHRPLTPATSTSTSPVRCDQAALTRWLNNHITTPDFLATHSFTLSTLRATLNNAVVEIVESLDPELTSWVDSAGNPSSNIEVELEEMFVLRRTEWVSCLADRTVSTDLADTVSRAASSHPKSTEWMRSHYCGTWKMRVARSRG